MPDGAEYILSVLSTHGYGAYIVGGCVRDALLSRHANDFDITTSALPEQIKSLFDHTVDTGIKHGTVTVIVNGEPYEVTTYRIDGEYSDMRHPVSVSFTDKLVDDLARRDFTVNAMAYNRTAGVVDAFGGIADLENKIIRAVRDPYLRFGEDALRILRGIRFAAVLDFDIEPLTARAIHDTAANLCGVSQERIYVEWHKLLGGKRAHSILTEFFDVVRVFLPELDAAMIPPRDAFDKMNAEQRQIALFSSLGADTFRACMRRLRTDSQTASFGADVLDSMELFGIPTDTELKKYLIGRRDNVALCASYLLELSGTVAAGTHERLCALISSDFPRRADMLALNGNDVMSLGFSGKRVGEIISALLLALAEGRAENTKEGLTAFIKTNFY